MSIINALQSTGYAISEFNSLIEFEKFCSTIGSIKQTTDVKITHGFESFPYINSEIPFHTDNPEIDIVSWFCVNQDDIAGESLVIDIRWILSHFTKEELAILERLELPAPVSKKPFPILQMQKNCPHIYLINRLWRDLEKSIPPSESVVVKKFLNELDKIKQAKSYLSIRLKKNQALFLNNEMMIHARGAISKNSSRHLVRKYIKSDLQMMGS
jgi:hypothetical protein